MHVCIFLRVVVYRPAYGPPIRGRELRMLKKEAYTGQPKTQLILDAPVIINDTCQLPGFVVNLSPTSKMPMCCMHQEAFV